MTRINDSHLLGYAMQALIESEVRLSCLQMKFPNFAVQLDSVRAPLLLYIEHLKKQWGTPYEY